MPVPVPFNEKQRNQALDAYEILDSEPEERFDRITRLAKRQFGTEIAVISLVDGDRQWFKSCDGLDASETPRDVSFCGHAIMSDEVMVVLDAASDPRFKDNPLVTEEPFIRFYAGAPLKTRDGFLLGTLCLIDSRPRDTFDDTDVSVLADLASIVMDQMELRLAMSDRLDRLEAQADMAERAKRQFFAVVNHELRTPLNIITGNCELMIDEVYGPVGDERQRGCLSTMLETAGHLSALVERILLASKIETGELRLDLGEDDAGRLAMRAAAMLQAAADAKGVTLETEIAGDVPALLVDGPQVLQALLQLGDNAIKFSGEGDAVTIGADLADDGWPRFAVVDRGPGLSAEDAERALDWFAQVDDKLARQHEGVGLGLPIARRLVELHGGRLDVDATPGGGTTVTVALPPYSVAQRKAS